MTERDEFAIPGPIATQEPGEDATRRRDTGTPVTQAREDSLASPAGEPVFVTVRNRSRKRGPALREADGAPEHRGSSFPTPVIEDRPSPRCVWRDYREGARHFGHEAALAEAAYWVFALAPLLVHMGCSLGAIVAERPARGWALVAFILIVLALAGVI